PLPRQPWLYTGGVLGVVFIAIAATIVRFTGVLLLGLGVVAGQVLGALILDLWSPGGHGAPGPATYAGAGLTLCAVVLAALSTISPGAGRGAVVATASGDTASGPRALSTLDA